MPYPHRAGVAVRGAGRSRRGLSTAQNLSHLQRFGCGQAGRARRVLSHFGGRREKWAGRRNAFWRFWFARLDGYGVTCVELTARLLFDLLHLPRLSCEPNAFNVAPSTTLQRAGFKYVKTYERCRPLNYHQPITRCVLEDAGLQQITMGVAGSRVE